jgi:hypothetical protein
MKNLLILIILSGCTSQPYYSAPRPPPQTVIHYNAPTFQPMPFYPMQTQSGHFTTCNRMGQTMSCSGY